MNTTQSICQCGHCAEDHDELNGHCCLTGCKCRSFSDQSGVAKPIDSHVPGGEFESEICLPVRVRYEVERSEEGERVVLAHVALREGAFGATKIPLRERMALEKEAALIYWATKDGKETP